MQKGDSMMCLADPRGIVFLATNQDMIFKSLWPVEGDRAELQEQYGKDQFPAIFPAKFGDGAKVRASGAQLYGIQCRNHPRRLVSLFFSPHRARRHVSPDRHFDGLYVGHAGPGKPGRATFISKSIPSLRQDGTGPFWIRPLKPSPSSIQIHRKLIDSNRYMATALGYTQKELLCLQAGRPL